MPRTTLGKRRYILISLFLLTVLVACEEPNTYVAPPPPTVTVATPLVTEVTDYLEFTGTTRSSAYAEVPARVAGVLQTMLYEPGSDVRAGDPLFEIEPEEYEAEVQRAQASLEQANARLLEKRQTLARAQELLKTNNIPRARYDQAVADFRSAGADVKASEAELVQAKLNLSYTNVVAPISGRAGRNLVDVGNLVGRNEATILTDITAYDPMYVYFDLNERDLLRLLEEIREQGKSVEPGARRDRKFEVELGLANEDGFPHRGVLDFASSGVDAETGTLQLRGSFDNPGRPPSMLPGLFARVRMPTGTRDNMPLVTERAIGADQSGQYVLILNSENVVEKRNVSLGSLVDGMRVIEEGLSGTERLVVRGVQRARPGATVEPEEIDMAMLSASALRNAAEEAKEAQRSSGADAPNEAESSETPASAQRDQPAN